MTSTAATARPFARVANSARAVSSRSSSRTLPLSLHSAELPAPRDRGARGCRHEPVRTRERKRPRRSRGRRRPPGASGYEGLLPRERRPSRRGRRERVGARAVQLPDFSQGSPPCSESLAVRSRLRASRARACARTASPPGSPLGSGTEGRTYCAQMTALPSRSALIFSAEKPQSASTSAVCCPGCAGGSGTAHGVRLKRGAGAGCLTPPTSMKVLRSLL